MLSGSALSVHFFDIQKESKEVLLGTAGLLLKYLTCYFVNFMGLDIHLLQK
jgi:hypothetical protein